MNVSSEIIKNLDSNGVVIALLISALTGGFAKFLGYLKETSRNKLSNDNWQALLAKKNVKLEVVDMETIRIMTTPKTPLEEVRGLIEGGNFRDLSLAALRVILVILAIIAISPVIVLLADKVLSVKETQRKLDSAKLAVSLAVDLIDSSTTGNYDSLIERANSLAQAYPTYDSYRILGEVYDKAGRYADAISSFKKMLTFNSKSIAVYNNIAFCAMQIKDMKLADTSLTEAEGLLGEADSSGVLRFTVGVNRAKYHLMMSELAILSKNSDKATKQADLAVEKYNSLVELKVQGLSLERAALESSIGRWHELTKDYESAADHYGRSLLNNSAVLLNEDYLQSFYNYANVLTSTDNKKKDGIRLLESLVSILDIKGHRLLGPAYFSIGLAYKKLGDHVNAKKFLLRAKEVSQTERSFNPLATKFAQKSLDELRTSLQP